MSKSLFSPKRAVAKALRKPERLLRDIEVHYTTAPRSMSTETAEERAARLKLAALLASFPQR